MNSAQTYFPLLDLATILLELAVLLPLLIDYWIRPDDRNRFRAIVLAGLIIPYNLLGNLFPNEGFFLPLKLQNVLVLFSFLAVTMYLVFYLYKAFRLAHLRFYVTIGSLIFLLLPFVLVFVAPYYVTGDLVFCKRVFAFVPFFYVSGFAYLFAKTAILKHKSKEAEESVSRSRVYTFAAGIALLCLISVPILQYSGDWNVVEHIVTTTGLLILVLTALRSSLIALRRDYMQSREVRKALNETTQQYLELVKEGNDKIDRLYKEVNENFVSWAHDVKTPLVLIASYVDEFIEKQDNTPELEVVKTNINKLIADIGNLSDADGFSKGFDRYKQKKVIDLSTLLLLCVDLFRPLAEKKSISIQSEISQNVLIHAHPEAMERVIRNIFENSVKYSDSGDTIAVKLSVIDSKIELHISDTGIGIPHTMLQHVFEPFVRVDNQNSNTQGLGMGLSIVKKIVDGLSGTIDMKSAENSGTAITVTFDTYCGDAVDIDNTYKISQDINLYIAEPLNDIFHDESKPYLLVVDDNVPMLSYLLYKLKEHYNVFVARDGFEALQKLRQVENIDLIISDVVMSPMDGFKFYEELSKMKIYDHIPFIFLSAKNTSHDKVAGMRMGAVDYIGKPFFFGHLHQKIESLLLTLKKQKVLLLSKLTQRTIPEAVKPFENKNTSPFEANCIKYGLTRREIEVYRYIRIGVPYGKIAERLHISERTVAKHAGNMFEKVNVTNKTELVNKMEQKLVDEQD